MSLLPRSLCLKFYYCYIVYVRIRKICHNFKIRGRQRVYKIVWLQILFHRKLKEEFISVKK